MDQEQMMRSEQDRFWSKVEKSDNGCLVWTAADNGHGYGVLRVWRDDKWTVCGAHRLAWEYAHGPRPQGMELDHICHNRACVNVEHLRSVTVKQNQENRAANAGSTSAIRGVHWNARNKNWHVKVHHNGQYFWGGAHQTLESATGAAVSLRNKLYTHNELDRHELLPAT